MTEREKAVFEWLTEGAKKTAQMIHGNCDVHPESRYWTRLCKTIAEHGQQSIIDLCFTYQEKIAEIEKGQ